MTETGPERRKKPYETPRITVISLRPEEAVLAHCKTASTAGPIGAGCQAPGGGTCRGHGS